MANNTPPTRDLSQILQILAATSANNPPAAPPPVQPAPSADPRLRNAPTPAADNLIPPAAPQPAPRPDPRSIRTLPAARRYIVRHLSSDAALLSRISRMKSRQHEHESAWASGRREIQKRHAAIRAQGDHAEQLSGILRSLGGGPVVKTNAMTEEKELAAYDAKVYRRVAEMVGYMRKELGDMGVPLFCVGAEWEEEILKEGTTREELERWRGEVVELLGDLAEENPA